MTKTKTSWGGVAGSLETLPGAVSVKWGRSQVKWAEEQKRCAPSEQVTASSLEKLCCEEWSSGPVAGGE